MPRVARVKTPESIFHVMSRSISEIDLFRDDSDKLEYIQTIKKYQTIHKFSVYCYCLMTNHVHLIIDVNGADISQIMHRINFSYASYFNKKYKRHGHLFQDRFHSKIIGNMRYLKVASAYIHNNPIVIREFSQKPEDFLYSSLAVYLGLKKDPFGLVNSSFVLSLFGDDYKSARKKYYDFVFVCNDKCRKEMEFEDEGSLYDSKRVVLLRNICYKTIVKYVADKTNTPLSLIYTKNNKKATSARALLVLLLKSLCNYNSTQICATIGNITQSNVANLTHLGLGLLNENATYHGIIEEFIEYMSSPSMA